MSKLTEDFLVGDQLLDADDNLVYTVTETQFGPTHVDLMVRWALDQGVTTRTVPYGVELNIVTPEPDPEP
jgi:hypothetical protein